MTKNNSTEWLDEILSDFVVWCMCGKDECIKSQNYELSKQAIRSHLLADVMRVLGSSKYNCYDEQCWYDLSEDEQKGIQELYEHLEQAFNELLRGSDE